jgi:poly(A) polymerase
MSAQGRMLGVTPPIKSDLPTKEELDRTASLLEELKRQKTFESPVETNKRQANTSAFALLAKLLTTCLLYQGAGSKQS